MSIAQLVNEIGEALATVAPEVRLAIAKLVGAVCNSRDPLRAVQRATAAAASEVASEETIRAGLKARSHTP